MIFPARGSEPPLDFQADAHPGFPLNQLPPPTEDQFLIAPAEVVASVAPKSMVVAPGGTRREAVMAGINPNSDDFAKFMFGRMSSQFDMMFRNGVRHLFSGTITPNQWNEVGPYRHKLIGWVASYLASDEALETYNRNGWKVRLTGWQTVPEFQPVAERLERETPREGTRSLWWWTAPTYESIWEQLLAAAHRTGARTRDELIRAFYGEDVPLISLYLGFGKPEVSPVHLPPILAGQVQCYWTMRPGYSLDEVEFRKILYDYAYLRPTWKADKTGRAENAVAHRDMWLQGPTLGLGMRLGEDFWYPAPFAPPPLASETMKSSKSDAA